MSKKYIANHMVRPSAVRKLREEGYDIVHSEEVGIPSYITNEDKHIAKFAKDKIRIIVSCNSTFVNEIPSNLKDVDIILLDRQPKGHDEWCEYLREKLEK